MDTDTLVLTDIQYLLDLDMKGTWGPGAEGRGSVWAERERERAGREQGERHTHTQQTGGIDD